MKKAGVSPHWGGAREGAGRKKNTTSERQKMILLRALKAHERETGTSWQNELASMAYLSPTNFLREKLSALKLIADIIIIKESHMVKEEHKYEHGVVELPALRPKEEKPVATA